MNTDIVHPQMADIARLAKGLRDAAFHRCLGDGGRDWVINGKSITEQVEDWMQHRGITWPWDALTQVEFLLTFT